MVIKNRSLPESHFRRHEGIPGYLYIARNEFFGPDLYKVGYTTEKCAQIRINKMNKKFHEGGAAALGFFKLAYEKKTLNSYGAEQIAHSILNKYRATPNREHFKAPLEDIIAAVNLAVIKADKAIQKEQNEQQAKAIVQAAEDKKFVDIQRIANLEKVAQLEKENTLRQQRARDAIEKAHWEEQEAQLRQFQVKKTPYKSEPVANMGKIDITCPNCAQSLTANIIFSATRETQKIRCPKCSSLFFSDGRALENNPPIKLAPPPPSWPQHFESSVQEQLIIRKKSTVTTTDIAIATFAIALIIITLSSNTIPSTVTATVPSIIQPQVVSNIAKTPSQQTLEAAFSQALLDYPYLRTSAGDKASHLIIAEQNKLIKQGVLPAVAFSQAAKKIAPQYAPKSHLSQLANRDGGKVLQFQSDEFGERVKREDARRLETFKAVNKAHPTPPTHK